ncbi:MAG: PQQ-binding-like beta-propeller repeat protein [Bacteroidales bacterium]|nr:PQQ-binding-like beta-propeller repeat protein [Bacteroidales bacterium]MCF8405462.1 PQQ-binding-like beta-propeller repeat protein [Bacteroidales bacterium]
MKKSILIALFAMVMNMVFAQDDMPIVWETKLGHTIDYYGTDLSDQPNSYSFAANDKELSFFKNSDGSLIWTKSFKDMAPKLRKIDELLAFWESNTIFLFDRKLGKDQIACVDMTSGELLWNTDKYQEVTEDVVIYIPEEDGFAISLKKELVFIKARTGEEVWSTTKFKGVVGKYVYDASDHTMVMVNFVPGGLAAFFSGFKNQIARINMTNGEIMWESTYIGRAERKVISREFIYALDVIDGKVFLRMNGMQVYDYNTGASLWSAAFDFTADILKAPQGSTKFGVYGAVADPYIVGEDIYVLDMSNKKSQYVKKYDLQTGKLIWSSKEIKGARAIPGLKVVGDKVALQIGGRVETQYYRRYKCGDSWCSEWGITFPEVKPFGVQALNASDGTMAWESERFKKGITNSVSFDNYYIVCSGKALYSMDINSGDEKYEVPVAKGGVGQASLVMKYGDDVIVVIGEKGVSTFKAQDGDLIGSGKYKSASLESRIDDVVILKTAKADLAAFTLPDCNYKEFKAKTGAGTSVTTNGEHIFVYEKKLVTKLKTR